MSRQDDAGGDDKRAVALAGDEDATLHWQPVLCTLHLNFCASGSTTTTATAAAAGVHASRNNSNNNNNSNSNTATFVRAGDVYSGISVIRYRKEQLPHDAHARRQPHDHNSSHDTACAVHDDTALQPSHTSAARAPSAAAATTTTVSAYDAFVQLRRRVAALHGLPLHAQTRTTTPPPSSSSASLLLPSSPPRDNDKDSSSTARGLTVQSYKVAMLTSSGRLPLRLRAVTELSLSANAAADGNDDDKAAVDDNGGDDTRHDKRAAAAVDDTTTDTRHNNRSGGRGAVRVAAHGKAAHEQQRHNNNSSSMKPMRCGQHAAPRTTAAAAATPSSSCATKVVQFDRAASLPAGTLVELTVHFTGVVGAVDDGSSSGGGIYAAEAAASSSSSCRAALTSSNCNTHVSQPPHSHTSARTATAATTATTAALLTHFEVALARRAFACPDDVHHRLEWQLATLQLPACYTAAFCNGATLRHTKALHAQRAVQYSFERCGPLPAYALAFAAFASSSSSSLCAAASTACASSPLDMVTSTVTLPSATHFVRARRRRRRRAHAAAMTKQQQQQGQRPQQQRHDDDDSSSDDDDDDTHNNGSSSSSSGCCADTASVDVPLCVAAMRGRGVSHATLQRVRRLTSTAVRVLQRYFACPLPLLQCSHLCVLLVPMLPYVSGMEHHACIFLRDDMFVSPSSSSTTTAAATATAGTRPVQRRPHNNNNNNKNDNDDDEDESFDAAALAAQAGLIVHEVAHHWIGNAIGVPFAVKEGVCQLLESVFSATLLHGHDSNNSSNNNNNNSAHATRNAAKATGTTAAAPQQQPSDGKHNATTTTTTSSSRHSAGGRPRRGSGSGAFDVAEVAHGREFTSHTYQSALAAMQRVVAQHGMARVSRGLRRVVRRHVTRVMAAREAAAAAEYGGASYSSNNNNNDDGDDDSGYCGCNIATLTASHDADGYSGDDAYDVRMLTDAAAAGDDNGVSTTPPYLSSKAFMRYLCDEHR